MDIKTKSVAFVVLCHNTDGEPVFHCCQLQVGQEDAVNGEAHIRAKNNATENGKIEPMIAFSQFEPAFAQLEFTTKWAAAARK